MLSSRGRAQSVYSHSNESLQSAETHRTLYSEFKHQYPKLVRIDETTAKQQRVSSEAETQDAYETHLTEEVQLLSRIQELTQIIDESTRERAELSQKLSDIKHSSTPILLAHRPTSSVGTCIKTLQGHSAGINSVDFHKPYDYMLSASSDATVKIWDLAAWQCVATFKQHNGPVNVVQYDGQMACSADTTIKLWRAGSVDFPYDPEMLSQVRTFDGHAGTISCLQFSTLDGMIVSGSSDNTVKLFDIVTGSCIDTIRVHSEHDIKQTMESNVHIHRVNSGLASLQYNNEQPSKYEGITTLQYDSVGALATGGHDGILRMYDMRAALSRPTIELQGKASCTRSISAHPLPITKLQYDGYQMLSSSLDRTLKVFDMRMPRNEPVQSILQGVVDFQFDQSRIVMATGENDIVVVDKERDTQSILNGHMGVQAIKFHGKSLVSAGSDCQVKVWEI